MDVDRRWIRDDEALALLDVSGEPFNGAHYRRAWTQAVADWQDVSFGARTSDGTYRSCTGATPRRRPCNRVDGRCLPRHAYARRGALYEERPAGNRPGRT